MKEIVVLVPVLNRPHRVAPLVESFHAAGSAALADLLFIVQEGDDAELDAIGPDEAAGRCRSVMVPAEKQSWAKKINEGYALTCEPWMLLCGDDVAFVGGWTERLAPYMDDFHVGVIGTNNGSLVSTARHERQVRRRLRGRQAREPVPPPEVWWSPHPVVSRGYIDMVGTVDELGKVVHDGYHHNFPDTELCATARMREAFVFAHDVVLQHLHWSSAGGVALDETYKLGMSRYADDEKLFNARRERFGLP